MANKIYAAIGHWKGNKDIHCVTLTQNTKKDFMADCVGNGLVAYLVLTEDTINKLTAENISNMEIFEQVRKMTTNYRVWNIVTDFIAQAGYIITEQVAEIIAARR